MTYDELDQKTVDRAVQECLKNPNGPSLAMMIAKLAREQGPVLITEPKPEPVDPDLAEARALASDVYESKYPTLAWKFRNGTEDKYETITGIVRAIKRGRALAAAEAKPKPLGSDLAEAKRLVRLPGRDGLDELALICIARGRELERAEAKPEDAA